MKAPQETGVCGGLVTCEVLEGPLRGEALEVGEVALVHVLAHERRGRRRRSPSTTTLLRAPSRPSTGRQEQRGPGTREGGPKAGPHRPEQAPQRGVADDGVGAVGARGEDGHGDSRGGSRGRPRSPGRCCGQGVPVGGAVDLRLPAGEGLVDGRGLLQHPQARGEVVHALALQLVGHADLHLVEGVQDVEEREGDAVEGVDAHRVPGGHGVEPAAAPGAPGGGAVLVAPLADQVALCVLQLGHEGARAHAGAVGLEDADDALDAGGGDAQARAGPARRAVARGDEGVGAVVHVQHGALGALAAARARPLSMVSLTRAAVSQTRGASSLGQFQEPRDGGLGRDRPRGRRRP